jgi:hypothetical protein
MAEQRLEIKDDGDDRNDWETLQMTELSFNNVW